MKTDEQIIEAMNLQDEIKEELSQDELHEYEMRSDLNYFLKHSEFEEFREMYQKLSQKAWEYGWVDVKVKDWL